MYKRQTLTWGDQESGNKAVTVTRRSDTSNNRSVSLNLAGDHLGTNTQVSVTLEGASGNEPTRNASGGGGGAAGLLLMLALTGLLWHRSRKAPGTAERGS